MVFKSLSMYLFSLVLATTISAIMADYDPNKIYTIRPAYPRYGDFALDTTQNQVLLQEYRYRRAYELFHILYSDQPGLFYIVSEPSGEFLDVDASVYSHAVITAPRNSRSRSQLWYLEDDGRIINADQKLALDVAKNNFEKGNPIIVYPDYGQVNQVFKIVEENLLENT